jgi:hypothetical protein
VFPDSKPISVPPGTDADAICPTKSSFSSIMDRFLKHLLRMFNILHHVQAQKSEAEVAPTYCREL